MFSAQDCPKNASPAKLNVLSPSNVLNVQQKPFGKINCKPLANRAACTEESLRLLLQIHR
jgi:hypothetical protein